MKKTSIILCLLVLIILISGCTQKATNREMPLKESETTGKEAAQQTMPAKWADYVASGKPYECDVTIAQGEEIPLKMKVYLKGKYVREEMTVEGEPIKTIFRENKAYTLNEVNIEKRDESLKDCDWIIYSSGETTGEIMSEQFYDISTFEEMGMAEYTCKEANFGNEKFDTSGKVCDVSQMIGTEMTETEMTEEEEY